MNNEKYTKAIKQMNGQFKKGGIVFSEPKRVNQLEKSSWKIDHDSPAYRGTLYIIRSWSNGLTERKLINTNQIPFYIRSK